MLCYQRALRRSLALLLLLWQGLASAGLLAGWCCEPQAACCVVAAGPGTCTPCGATPVLAAAKAAAGPAPRHPMPAVYAGPADMPGPATLPWRPPQAAE